MMGSIPSASPRGDRPRRNARHRRRGSATMRKPMVLLAGAAMLALTACGGVGGGDDSGTGDDQSGDLTADPSGSITTIGFALPDEIATVRVDTFREMYPDVEVNINEGGFDEQQFLTSVSSGNPTELVYIPGDQVGAFAARGAIQPLDECIEQRDIDLDQYRPNVLDLVQYDGSTYAIPEFYNTPVLVVNNTVLAEAGLSAEDIDISDQESLVAAAEALTVRNGSTYERIGIHLRLPDLTPFYGVVDGNPWVAAADDFRLDDPATVATMERLKAVQDAQGGHTALKDFENTWDLFGEGNPFAQNQVGAMVIEQWYVNVLANTSPDVDITVLPITGAGGETVTWATSNAWAIPKDAANTATSCEFMKVMTAPDTWAAAAEERIRLRDADGKAFTGIYTANEAADDKVFGELYTPGTGENQKWDDAVQAVLEAQADAWVVPANPVGAQFKAAWLEAANRILAGTQDAASALAEAQDKVEQALADVG
ncbi:extracellular solute-binding protein [Jiangella ureilytica]|uniref:Extracellular solute-binding protein n=2 Tax=Jiangella ureilytica TaxID=2530374 RepID=A0A4R4RYV5_9ACTN|nr:extracellular solute-binding protein [Jiangella ureilytica]